jgi:hypothetical protein
MLLGQGSGGVLVTTVAAGSWRGSHVHVARNRPDKGDGHAPRSNAPYNSVRCR